jgi:hypothetical protein
VGAEGQAMIWYFRILRRLLRIGPPRVSRGQAVEIAVNEMNRRGESLACARESDTCLPTAHEGLRSWSVCLNPDFRPCCTVVIDNQTGEVLQWLSPPR